VNSSRLSGSIPDYVFKGNAVAIQQGTKRQASAVTLPTVATPKAAVNAIGQLKAAISAEQTLAPSSISLHHFSLL